MAEACQIARYAELAANRRHFESLFIAVVAFTLIYALLLGCALNWLVPQLPPVPLMAAGATLIFGAFVAQRLLLRARSCFEAMRSCWSGISGEPQGSASISNKPGAMALVLGGIYSLGIGGVLYGLWLMFIAR
ncbi:MAG: hypothetical protein EOP13_28345 [Pseudomonas sp.]|uniref:hypothetical protein n=1 Tax=Pseudomonas sp. TaxID=306 RepID=UPI0012271A59|nr:hypothetical protein [Pseudomonas sp.]RZI67258.1 MAG: hypothetical protein EOP13_28345 [Pseudomonas sp.]